jgi:transcriptional regulator with XRE-family HTH domain
MQQRGRPTRGTRSREDLARSVVATLRQARDDAGLTRKRLSELSGVSGHTIAKIEQAAVTDPGFAVVAAIAGALELPLDDLVRRASGKQGAGGRGSSTVAGPDDRIGE